MGKSGGATHFHSSSSSSSSMDRYSSSSNDPASTICRRSSSDLSTDLKLGLNSISPNSQDLHHHHHHHSFSYNSSTSISREEHLQRPLNWPPIKSILRSTIVDEMQNKLHPQSERNRPSSFFVKVYMEGIVIGRKLNLLAYHSYDGLITVLCQMFKTTILCPNKIDEGVLHYGKYHLLTYEDQEGDWMMVGDVPWELFVTSVKRLKITRAERCQL
ncbi:Auxin-responsive protein [Quillaja saponaria]|uniref:Auxin-induced protein n=1 Tax=Quillaja saponaria TaxID=32244 RepID=A0AAD7QFF1_QUISA|nr:Auxin-responsive protein [Quillaja saponaria]